MWVLVIAVINQVKTDGKETSKLIGVLTWLYHVLQSNPLYVTWQGLQEHNDNKQSSK